MILKSTLRSACILTWALSIPSILGFHLTSNSIVERNHAQLANSFVTSCQSPILPNQRLTRGIHQNAIWGPNFSSPSSSSSSDGEDTEDEEVTMETEKSPTEEAVVDTSMSSTDESTNGSSTDSTEKSLLTLVNEIGNNFKVMAQKSTAKGYQCEDQNKKIMFAAKACLYYTLFIIYRAYRGFFVLLPATFRQVYRNMEAAMNTGNLSLEEIGYTESGKDVTSGNSKWQTKVTVSILTSVITMSYIVGGVVKMLSKFVRTIAKTSDVPKSFGAAADEVMNYEGRISRVGKVNGEGSVETNGLSP